MLIAFKIDPEITIPLHQGNLLSHIGFLDYFRCEFRISEHLAEKGFGSFLPLCTRKLQLLNQQASNKRQNCEVLIDCVKELHLEMNCCKWNQFLALCIAPKIIGTVSVLMSHFAPWNFNNSYGIDSHHVVTKMYPLIYIMQKKASVMCQFHARVHFIWDFLHLVTSLGIPVLQSRRNYVGKIIDLHGVTPRVAFTACSSVTIHSRRTAVFSRALL